MTPDTTNSIMTCYSAWLRLVISKDTALASKQLGPSQTVPMMSSTLILSLKSRGQYQDKPRSNQGAVQVLLHDVFFVQHHDVHVRQILTRFAYTLAYHISHILQDNL